MNYLQTVVCSKVKNLLVTLHGSTAPSFSEFEQQLPLSGSFSSLVVPWLLLSSLSLNTTGNWPQSRFASHIQMCPRWLLFPSIATSLSSISLLFQWFLFFFFLCTCHSYERVTSIALVPTHFWKKKNKKTFPSLSASAPPIPQTLSTEDSRNVFTVSLS